MRRLVLAAREAAQRAQRQDAGDYWPTELREDRPQ